MLCLLFFSYPNIFHHLFNRIQFWQWDWCDSLSIFGLSNSQKQVVIVSLPKSYYLFLILKNRKIYWTRENQMKTSDLLDRSAVKIPQKGKFKHFAMNLEKNENCKFKRWKTIKNLFLYFKLVVMQRNHEINIS